MTAGTLFLQSMGSDWRDLQKVITHFMSCILWKVGCTASVGFISFGVQHACNVHKSTGWHTELIICLLEYRLYYF